MAKVADDELAVFVVWSSQLGAREGNVPPAAELMPDRRARHFWDAGRRVGAAFAASFGLDEPAWDVWMLFDRDARWGEQGVPQPAWWEHQLGGLPRDRRLDPQRLATKAADLLARPKPGSDQ